MNRAYQHKTSNTIINIIAYNNLHWEEQAEYNEVYLDDITEDITNKIAEEELNKTVSEAAEEANQLKYGESGSFTDYKIQESENAPVETTTTKSTLENGTGGIYPDIPTEEGLQS